MQTSIVIYWSPLSTNLIETKEWTKTRWILTFQTIVIGYNSITTPSTINNFSSPNQPAIETFIPVKWLLKIILIKIILILWLSSHIYWQSQIENHPIAIPNLERPQNLHRTWLDQACLPGLPALPTWGPPWPALAVEDRAATAFPACTSRPQEQGNIWKISCFHSWEPLRIE